MKFHSEVDVEYQLCAEAALKNGLKKLEKNRKSLRKKTPLQAALISLDAKKQQG